MPNWCYNSISIEGEPQKMKSLIEVINIFQKQEGKEKMGLMRCLIGLPPDVKMSDYNNQGWYETNIAWFGTKWDFPNDYDINIDISEDNTQVVIGVSSAWSPPINAFQRVAEKYGVKVEYKLLDQTKTKKDIHMSTIYKNSATKLEYMITINDGRYVVVQQKINSKKPSVNISEHKTLNEAKDALLKKLDGGENIEVPYFEIPESMKLDISEKGVPIAALKKNKEMTATTMA